MDKSSLFVRILTLSTIIMIICSGLWYSIEFNEPFFWIVSTICLSPAIILLLCIAFGSKTNSN